jgi:hemoglobin/transferrin/lactoferrin receptor protein
MLNLFTEYRLSTIDGLVIRAAIDNVFDEEYADRATYGADFSSLTPLYEPGRTISLTAGYTF